MEAIMSWRDDVHFAFGKTIPRHLTTSPRDATQVIDDMEKSAKMFRSGQDQKDNSSSLTKKNLFVEHLFIK